MKTNTNLTRRSFLAASSLGAMTLRTPSLLAQKKDVFETLLPKGCQRILAVRQDGSLLALLGTGEGSVSRDGGETWQTPFPFLQEGRPMTGTRGQLVTLNEGRLGMVYSEEVESQQGRGNHHRTLRFASSEDGGKTWSGGVDIDLPGPLASTLGAFLQVPFGRLRQLSSGRLLLPVYWQFNGLHSETREAFARGIHQGKPIRLEGHGHRPQMSGCYAYFSDDDGASWERSEGSIMVWPLPGEHDLGGFGGTSEPVVQELRDSRILMLLRTKVGRFFQSISGDGGKSWQAATPTQLSSGDVPCDLDRLRSSRDLLVIWNQTSGQEIRAGYYRSRLSVALSSNEGRSWSNFKTVESSPGLHEGRTDLSASGGAHPGESECRNSSRWIHDASLSLSGLRSGTNLHDVSGRQLQGGTTDPANQAETGPRILVPRRLVDFRPAAFIFRGVCKRARAFARFKTCECQLDRPRDESAVGQE